MYIEDKDIHKGHRSRMRAKLSAYGPRIFDTYELLEMLLYYVIPYRDTNPIAKRLLATFGSLKGVLNASKEELALVDGIGDKCAEFILLAGRVMAEEDALMYRNKVEIFDDYNRVGRYLVSYFENNDSSVCMMMLDNAMRLIGVANIPVNNFISAAVKPRYFIDEAIKTGASIAIIAHKRHSLLYFSDEALATDKLIRSELSNIGVTVVEHYIICGKNYTGIRPQFSLGTLVETPELERFFESVPEELGGYYD